MRRWIFYRFIYPRLMEFAHKYNWHYAPPSYPEGDTLLWCDWCGFRAVVNKRSTDADKIKLESAKLVESEGWRNGK